MKIVLLDTLTFGDTDLSAFYELGEVEVFATTSKEQTQERITNAVVIVTNKVVITDALMAASPKLKLICVAATGMNNVDLEAAKRRGIEVKNVSGYSTASVI
ncbi:MAG: hydroxyacid dehydrogenase, partial [Campylobacterota bacterium]